jgi:hypothetical protein
MGPENFQNIGPAVDASVPPVDPAMQPPADSAAPVDGMPMDKAAAVAELEGGSAALKAKNDELNQKIANGEANYDSMRQEILMDLFDIMKKNGVDPGDPAAVRDFLEKLSSQDPDLFDMFEMAFNNLAGAPDTGQPETQMSTPPMPPAPPGAEPPQGGGGGGNLMDKFKNLAPEMMRGDSADIAPPPASPPGL